LFIYVFDLNWVVFEKIFSAPEKQRPLTGSFIKVLIIKFFSYRNELQLRFYYKKGLISYKVIWDNCQNNSQDNPHFNNDAALKRFHNDL